MLNMYNKVIESEELAPCPLCGRKVQIISEAKLILFDPGEDLPTYHVRCHIKCPTEFLNLDLYWRGYADAEGKPEQEQRTMLSAIQHSHIDKTRKIWNTRVEG